MRLVFALLVCGCGGGPSTPPNTFVASIILDDGSKLDFMAPVQATCSSVSSSCGITGTQTSPPYDSLSISWDSRLVTAPGAQKLYDGNGPAGPTGTAWVELFHLGQGPWISIQGSATFNQVSTASGSVVSGTITQALLSYHGPPVDRAVTVSSAAFSATFP